jgi:hypothetical protein
VKLGIQHGGVRGHIGSAFTARKRQAITARLIVRRVKDLNTKQPRRPGNS